MTKGAGFDRRDMHPDWCMAGFWVIGSVLIGLIILAILVIALPEFGDPAHLAAVAGDPQVLTALAITMGAGLNAVLILVLAGTPLAYVLSRSTFRGKGLVESIIDIPLILPHTVAGLMVYLLFMTRGVIGAPFASVGVFFEDAYPGIVVAMVFVAIPYYINAVREGFEKVPVHLENVARTLGASRFNAFRHIALPLTTRHILYGSLLAWGRAIGEFAAVIMIAYFPMVISTLIYYRFSTGGLAESRSIAFVMILVCAGIFILFRLLLMRSRGVVHDRA
jgi:molybdate/tungstate transport system permease protein